jgi:hypothetical protein
MRLVAPGNEPHQTLTISTEEKGKTYASNNAVSGLNFQLGEVLKTTQGNFRGAYSHWALWRNA